MEGSKSSMASLSSPWKRKGAHLGGDRIIVELLSSGQVMQSQNCSEIMQWPPVLWKAWTLKHKQSHINSLGEK